MASSTSPDGIVYPDATDPVAPLNAVFQDLAESVQDALDNFELSDLSDVDITSPLAGEILVYDGTDWVNSNLLLVETDEKIANYTLQITDTSKVVPINGTDLVVTVPLNSAVGFPIGSVVNIYNLNASGVIIIGAGGVTVRNAGMLGEFGEASLRKRGTNEWVLAGNVL